MRGNPSIGMGMFWKILFVPVLFVLSLSSGSAANSFSVHVGVPERGLEGIRGMVGDGDVLLHVLLPGDADVQEWRRQVQAVGLGGSVLFDRLPEDGRLPYPARFVNRLYMGDPVSVGEARRVLAVRGEAFVREDGKWVARRPLGIPERVGSWSHRFYDASGNCVSDDPVAGLPEVIQWQHGPALEDGTADGKVPRISQGLFVASDAVTGDLVCRDAGNGMLQWRFPARLAGRSDFAVVGGKVYFHYDPGREEGSREPVTGKLAEVDLGTGKLLRMLEGSIETGNAQSIIFRRPDEGGRVRKERPHPWFVVSSQCIVQAYAGTLVLLDRKSGKRLWQKDREGDRTWFSPTIAEDLGIVFAAECAIPARRNRHDGTHDAKAVHAWKLEDGKPLWINDQIHPLRDVVEKGKPRRVKAELKPLCYADGLLLAQVSSYQFREGGQLSVMDAKTGGQLWKVEFNSKELYTQGSQRAVIRNGEVIMLDGMGAKRWEARTGKETGEFLKHPKVKRLGRTNGACTASRATENWLFCNATLFIDKDWNVNLRKGTRGACGQGLTPGNGMLYTLPTPCDCGDYTRGYQGFAPVSGKAVGEDGRLETGAGMKKVKLGPVPEYAPGNLPWATYLANPFRRASLPGKEGEGVPKFLQWKMKLFEGGESRLEEDRKMSERFLGQLSAPVAADGLVVVSLPEQHAVAALDFKTGEELWRYATGGKVDSPPTLVQGLVVFGCDDGHVYVLEGGRGRLAWKFLAAPNRDKAMLHGHLGSTHPVIGSPLVVGHQVIVAAGTHTDTGGLHLWNLDLATGKPNHHRILDSAYFSPTTNGLAVADQDGSGFWLGQHVHLGLDLEDLPNPQKITPEIWFDRNGDRMRFRTNDKRGGSTHGWKGAVRSSWARAHRIARVGEVAYALKDPTANERHKVRSATTELLIAASGTWREKVKHWAATNQSLGNQESYSSLIHSGGHLFLGGGSRDGKSGFFQVVDAESGKLLHETTQLPARVTENGLVYTRGRLVISCEDGSLVVYGGKPMENQGGEEPCPECR